MLELGLRVRRYIAVTRPLQYAKHKNSRRTYLMLALTWLVSVAVSLPIALGMNYTQRRAQTPVHNSASYPHRATTSPDADTVYVLQRRVSHLLVDDVILHPVCRHRHALLANIPHYPHPVGLVGRVFRTIHSRAQRRAAAVSSGHALQRKLCLLYTSPSPRD